MSGKPQEKEGGSKISSRRIYIHRAEQARPDRVALTLLVGVLLVAAQFFAGSVGFGQTGYVLMVQQTPTEGGIISPSAGVHSFGANEMVTLNAAPAPGYEFLYWLGDVSDTSSPTTTVVLDGPKIIMAVFERVKYAMVLDEEAPPEPGVPGGGLMGAVPRFRMGSGGGTAHGGDPPERPSPVRRAPEISEEPLTGDDFPVPVPEPATALLLGMGGMLLLKIRRKR